MSQDPIGLRGGMNLFEYAPNPVGWTDPFGLLKSAKIHASLYARTLNTKVRKGGEVRIPTTVAAVVDRKTGRIFYGESGLTNTVTHPELIKSLPKNSIEKWSTTNCAEINALNKAFKARPSAKMEDFEVAAANTRTEKRKKPCGNCAITIERCH